MLFTQCRMSCHEPSDPRTLVDKHLGQTRTLCTSWDCSRSQPCCRELWGRFAQPAWPVGFWAWEEIREQLQWPSRCSDARSPASAPTLPPTRCAPVSRASGEVKVKAAGFGAAAHQARGLPAVHACMSLQNPQKAAIQTHLSRGSLLHGAVHCWWHCQAMQLKAMAPANVQPFALPLSNCLHQIWTLTPFPSGCCAERGGHAQRQLRHDRAQPAFYAPLLVRSVGLACRPGQAARAEACQGPREQRVLWRPAGHGADGPPAAGAASCVLLATASWAPDSSLGSYWSQLPP